MSDSAKKPGFNLTLGAIFVPRTNSASRLKELKDERFPEGAIAPLPLHVTLLRGGSGASVDELEGAADTIRLVAREDVPRFFKAPISMTLDRIGRFSNTVWLGNDRLTGKFRELHQALYRRVTPIIGKQPYSGVDYSAHLSVAMMPEPDPQRLAELAGYMQDSGFTAIGEFTSIDLIAFDMKTLESVHTFCTIPLG